MGGFAPRYIGAAFLVILAGVALIILGLSGRFGIALGVLIDPHDLEVDEGS